MDPSVIKKRKRSKAFSLAEVLLAMTLFSIFTTGIVYLALDTVQRESREQIRQEASWYALEGLEATRSIRDRSFLSLTNGDHGLSFESGQWEFIQAPEDIDGFYERTITIEDVYRDESGEITEDGGGTFDPETRKIIVEIDWMWRNVLPQSLVTTTYLTNWTGDDWIQTTCADWASGTLENIEYAITPAPPEDDCALELTILEQESSFWVSTDLGKHANDVVIEGNYAYLAVDDTNKGLGIVDVSNPASPTIVSQVNIGGKGRYIDHQGTEVYLGIAKSNGGAAIYSVSSPSAPSRQSVWNVSGYGNQVAVDSTGDYFYMGVETTGNSFLVYDRAPSLTLTDALDIDDEVRVVELNGGDYAFLGCENDTQGFRVVDITDPYNIALVATLDVGEEVNAIEVSGALAYVGTDNENSSLTWVDISDPENPELLGSLDVGGEIADIVKLGDYLYVAVDDQNQGLVAINVTNPLDPTVSYARDILGKGTGIDASGDYVYISTDTSNKGLVIIGATVAGVNLIGTYTSVAFDTGSESTRYNFIEWTTSEVAGGSIALQIRTADSLENLSSATWVGGDGTASTVYENPRTEIVLDPNRSGQRYFQFQVTIESDGVTTPQLESVRLNYNP